MCIRDSTETIVQLIAKSKRPKTIDKIVDAIFQIQGGYALVMLTQTSLIGVRDPYGIRPLVIGKLGNTECLTSAHGKHKMTCKRLLNYNQKKF